MRKSIRQRLRNRSVRSAVRSLVSRARSLIQDRDVGPAQATVREAQRALARAAQKGIMKRKTAARRTSRLMKRLDAARPS